MAAIRSRGAVQLASRESDYRRRWEQTAAGGERAKARWRAFEFAGVERGERIVESVRAHTPVWGKRLLDVGCGHGGTCVAFARAGARVFGTDLFPGQIELARVRAREHGVASRWFVADGALLAVKRESFDIIICNDVVEHVRDPEGLLGEIASALRPGGVLYLEAPNRLSPAAFYRDGHYGLFGLSLLPRRLARFYVCRLARRASSYQVFRLPTWWQLKRGLRRAGLAAQVIPDRRLGKLAHPELIEGGILRRLVAALNRMRLAGLVERLLRSPLWLALAPTMWRIISTKPLLPAREPAPPTCAETTPRGPRQETLPRLARPRVSVIIPCHDGAEDTLECLASVERMGYPNFDVIVVDDGSTDGTGERIARGHPRVTVLRGDGSLWWSGAVNLGIEEARRRGADYVLLLNNDCVVGPDLARRLVECAQNHPGAIVGSRVYDYRRPERLWFAGGRLDWLRGGCFFLHPRELDLHSEEATAVDWLGGMGVLIERRILEEVGLMEAEHLPQYWADCDFCLRARRAGFRVLVEPRARLWNKVESSGLVREGAAVAWRQWRQAFTSLRSQLEWRSARFFFRRHCPPRWRSVALARFYWRNVSALLRRSLEARVRTRPALMGVIRWLLGRVRKENTDDEEGGRSHGGLARQEGIGDRWGGVHRLPSGRAAGGGGSGGDCGGQP